MPCKLAWRSACYVGDEHGDDDCPQYDVVDDLDAAVHESFGLYVGLAFSMSLVWMDFCMLSFALVLVLSPCLICFL